MIDESLPLILPFFARQRLATETFLVASFASLYSLIFSLIPLSSNIRGSH